MFTFNELQGIKAKYYTTVGCSTECFPIYLRIKEKEKKTP